MVKGLRPEALTHNRRHNHSLKCNACGTALPANQASRQFRVRKGASGKFIERLSELIDGLHEYQVDGHGDLSGLGTVQWSAGLSAQSVSAPLVVRFPEILVRWRLLVLLGQHSMPAEKPNHSGAG